MEVGPYFNWIGIIVTKIYLLTIQYFFAISSDFNFQFRIFSWRCFSTSLNLSNQTAPHKKKSRSPPIAIALKQRTPLLQLIQQQNHPIIHGLFPCLSSTARAASGWPKAERWKTPFPIGTSPKAGPDCWRPETKVIWILELLEVHYHLGCH